MSKINDVDFNAQIALINSSDSATSWQAYNDLIANFELADYQKNDAYSAHLRSTGYLGGRRDDN